jgi:hypothetical protein
MFRGFLSVRKKGVVGFNLLKWRFRNPLFAPDVFAYKPRPTGFLHFMRLMRTSIG